MDKLLGITLGRRVSELAQQSTHSAAQFWKGNIKVKSQRQIEMPLPPKSNQCTCNENPGAAQWSAEPPFLFKVEKGGMSNRDLQSQFFLTTLEGSIESNVQFLRKAATQSSWIFCICFLVRHGATGMNHRLWQVKEQSHCQSPEPGFSALSAVMRILGAHEVEPFKGGWFSFGRWNWGSHFPSCS